MLGAVAAVAASAVIATSAAAIAATPDITTAWVPIGGSNLAYAGTCIGNLISSQVSAGAPAYVAAYADDEEDFTGCALTLQRSANGGKTWHVVRSRTIPPTKTHGDASAITADVFDGPGYRARACVITAGMPRRCTPAITLAAGTGVPASPAQPASFTLIARGLSAGNGSAWCGASMASTTVKKQAGSAVDAAFQVVRTACVYWIQVSANKGKTWASTGPRVVIAPPAGNPIVQAFLGPQPDGPGLIARTCAQAPDISATVICGHTW